MAVYRPGATLFDDPRISTAGVRPAIPEVGGGGGGFFGGLLGGGGGDVLDLYGDLFTPEQKKALKRRELTQGLFRMAEKLGAAAQPTRAPTSLGGTLGALGAGLGAFGSGGTGEETALKGMEVAEKVRASRAERAILAKAAPLVEAIASRLIQAGVPAAQAAQIATQAAGGATPAPATPGAPAGALPPDVGNIAGPASWGTPPPGVPPTPQIGAPLDSYGMPRQDLSRYGLPSRGGRPPPLPGVPEIPEVPEVPGSQTGLLPPPPGANPQMGGPNLLSADLYGGGGGSGLPFSMAAAGPTPGAAGDLPDFGQIRVEPLSGQAAPAGDKTSPEYLARRKRELDLVEKYESGGRNIEQQVVGPQGGYNPSVGRVTGPSSASGYRQMIDPTWREAARLAGIDTTQYPRAINAPRDVQQKAAEALYDKRGLADWAPYNARLAQAVGWTGGSARGGGTQMAASTLPDVGQVRVQPLGGEATPAGQGGVIPGLGVQPEALAALNAMLKMGGIKSDPFGSLLESYYKSPGYLAEAERTKTQAQKDIELKMDPLIVEQRKRAEYKVDTELKPKLEEAVQRLQSPILKEREQAKADIARVTKELELAGAAALRPNDATVIGPGGVLTTQKLTDLEFAKRQQARAERVAKGDTTMQPGDIVGTPIGAAPAEHQYIMTPEGKISAVPVPGTPAAEKAAEAANKKLQTEHQNLIARDTVVREVDNIGKLMENATLPTTGFVGSLLQNLGGTSANDIRVARQTLESRLSRDALNAQRAASPTGAAFGNTSDTDIAILRTSLVNLDQSQTREQFRDRLQILKQAYIDTVHGPGMSRLLPETQVLKTPERDFKEGQILDYPDGSQRQLKGNEWVVTKPPRQ